MILYVLIFKLSDRTQEDKRLWTEMVANIPRI
jgi:hypothetical protein